MYKYFLLVAFVPALALARTPVRECAGRQRLPEFVDVNGCTTSPCQLRDGAPISAFARGIVSEADSPFMNPFISIRFLGLELPFPLPPELHNACEVGVAPGTCPVSTGQQFDYNLNHGGQRLGVTGITVQIEVGLVGENRQIITCLMFDARIVP